MTQHSTLSPDRWRTFGSERQLLMIANEMNRVTSSLEPQYEQSRRLGYERVLALTDLTIEITERRGLRRELLRWRDLVAELYCNEANPTAHAAAFRVLLLLSPRGRAQLRAMGLETPQPQAPRG